MKHLYLPAFLVVSLSGLYSCKEKGSTIEFGNKVVEDSTYIASTVPAPQKHFVLVEEFTGAKCTNCPEAREDLKSISAANDNRLIVMGIHPFGLGLADPVPGSKYDFRTEEGSSIKNIYYYDDFKGIPSAGFDRSTKNKALLSTWWADVINDRLKLATPVNIDMVSSYDESLGKGTVEVKVTCTQKLDGNLKLSLVVVEDSLIDAQEFPRAEIQYDYVFMHVFRDYITTVNGDAINSSGVDMTEGRTFIRRFKNFDINKNWKAKNCKLIAFVHYDEKDKTEVLQAAEVHLTE